MTHRKPILLVDDDRVDVMTTKRALKDIHVTNPVYTAGNGEEALELLRDEKTDKPGIILLDLNMPRMNGTDFLSAIKADVELRQIPIIVLTVSNDEIDKEKCFQHSAAGYIVKPHNYEEFIYAIKMLDAYWSLSELPFPDV